LVSEISKVAYKYLQEIEGKNPPNLRVDTLARIAKALKISASKLLDF
jgi:transcriptional regulator with XRE-family HTH domain